MYRCVMLIIISILIDSQRGHFMKGVTCSRRLNRLTSRAGEFSVG